MKINFIIKYHPAAFLKGIKVDIKKWPKHFKKSEKLFSDLLIDADLVLYYSSSTGLEALTKGVPVIKYYSETVFDQDPLLGFDEFQVTSCSFNNMKDVVYKKLNYSDDEKTFKNKDMKIKYDFFSPVKIEAWEKILNLR